MSVDVYVQPEWNYAGQYHYSVWVDGEKYDEFTSLGWLTHREMIDVARGYANALTDPLSM